jgi:hypothetical protein
MRLAAIVRETSILERPFLSARVFDPCQRSVGNAAEYTNIGRLTEEPCWVAVVGPTRHCGKHH